MLVNSAGRGSSAWYIGDPGTHDPTMDAPRKALAACRDSIIDNAHVVPTLHRIYMHVHETWKGHFARARARADRGCMFRNKISYIISYNISKIFVLLFPYVHVNMPRRFSNLSLLRRWLPDAPLVFAKASECTLLLNLQPPYACDLPMDLPCWRHPGF